MTDEMETAREEYLNSNESAFDAFGSGWRRGRASLEEENRRLRQELKDLREDTNPAGVERSRAADRNAREGY